VFVKICGITSEADALLAVAFGADALGFLFAPSPRQMTPSAVADIVKRLPREVLTVGVFRDESRQRTVEIANSVGLGAVQLHGRETPEDARWVRERVPCTIKAFSAGETAIGRFADFGADFLLIDGSNPGSGAVFDWRLAEGVADPTRMFVAGGLTASNVGDAIAYLHPFGVDVATGVESSIGHKDPQKLRDFVAAARRAADLVRAEHPADPVDIGDANSDEPDDSAAPYDWMEG
jgi:phosphoribosylanthranilate isomerase